VLVFWILTTLFLAAASAYLGRRWGAAAPMAVFATLTVIANVTAGKIVSFWGWAAPAAVIIYAATFLLTDIIAEVWGREEATRAVWLGFYANLILFIYVSIAVRWEAMPFAEDYARMFGEVLGPVPRIVMASMIAYLVSQHHDVFAFHLWKRRTGGRFLWLRNNASTLVSQAIDTGLFITIAFWGKFSGAELLSLLTGQYLAKVTIALLDTPFCYLFAFLARSSAAGGRKRASFRQTEA